MATFSDVIAYAATEALGFSPADALPNDVRDFAVNFANSEGKTIWDAWPWDNTKLDEFAAPAAVDGVITFDSTVDTIRAIRGVPSGATEGARVWNQNDLRAATAGVLVSGERFTILADSGGCRRIRVDSSDTTTAYQVLATKRWTDATVESGYDDSNPSATPTDYRVLEFPIDRALQAFRAAVRDRLRQWMGMAAVGDVGRLMDVALNRELRDGDREQRFDPRTPRYEEVGNWW